MPHERTTERRLRALSALFAAAFATAAQSQGNPLNGRLLFEDTIDQTGQSFTGNCTSCHTSIENRRQAISGSPFGPVTFQTAATRLAIAISNVGAMNQFAVLTDEERDDLAAYVADTPKTSQTDMAFNAGQTFPLVLTHAVATSATVFVANVALSGMNASDFSATGACQRTTLMAGNNCQMMVSFNPQSAGNKTARLTFTLDPSDSTQNFTREVTLTGGPASPPPPAPAPSPAPAPAADDGGGGALDGWWLAGLLAAIAWMRRALRARR